MHYYSTPVTHSSTGLGMHVPDRRRSPRRSLACRVTVRLSKDEVLYGFSVDLSTAGIGITVPKKIAAEQECNFTLSFFANGKSHRMEASGRIVSCVCSGMDGFRVGIKFTQLDANAQEIIENILG